MRIIGPFPPGGGTDIFARMVGQKLTASLSQPFIVDNRAGAGGNIGVELAVKSPSDGYTLLVTTATLAINPGLNPKLPFDARRDLAPITLFASVPHILCVHPALPVKSVKDLIALAKAKPDQLNYASPSSGSSAHLTGELLKTVADIKMTHIPYKGGGPALAALISGEVMIGFPVPLTAQLQIKAGKLRALAVTSRRRSQIFPAVPTMIESGLGDFESIQWYGALAPAGTPREIVARLHVEMTRALNLPDVRERIAAEGADLVGNTPEEFAAFIAAEMTKWAKVIKLSGARSE